MNSTDSNTRNGRPMPRWVGWLGVLIAVILIGSVLTVLAGCGGCEGHGGVAENNKGTITCDDGTVV